MRIDIKVLANQPIVVPGVGQVVSANNVLVTKEQANILQQCELVMVSKAKKAKKVNKLNKEKNG